MSEVSRETQLLRLDNQLRDLREQRRRTQPVLQFLFALVFAGLFILFGLPFVREPLFFEIRPINILGVGAGVAAPIALIAGILALVKALRLNREIKQVQTQIHLLEGR